MTNILLLLCLGLQCKTFISHSNPRVFVLFYIFFNLRTSYVHHNLQLSLLHASLFNCHFCLAFVKCLKNDIESIRNNSSLQSKRILGD